jgi:hypothetical protein
MLMFVTGLNGFSYINQSCTIVRSRRRTEDHEDFYLSQALTANSFVDLLSLLFHTTANTKVFKPVKFQISQHQIIQNSKSTTLHNFTINNSTFYSLAVLSTTSSRSFFARAFLSSTAFSLAESNRSPAMNL